MGSPECLSASQRPFTMRDQSGICWISSMARTNSRLLAANRRARSHCSRSHTPSRDALRLAAAALEVAGSFSDLPSIRWRTSEPNSSIRCDASQSKGPTGSTTRVADGSPSRRLVWHPGKRDGQITSVKLSWNRLIGRVPAEVGQRSSLEWQPWYATSLPVRSRPTSTPDCMATTTKLRSAHRLAQAPVFHLCAASAIHRPRGQYRTSG